MTVVAIVPAHDEADRISATVSAIRAIPEVDAVLVVDDASTDGTAEAAERAGAVVLPLDRNLGKGGALEAGLEAAREADVVLLLDADLGASAAHAAPLLEAVTSGAADMSIGVLPRPIGSGGFGLVKRLARAGIRTLGGDFDAQAPLSGQRALTRDTARIVRPLGSGYGAEVMMTIRALRAGFRVVEVPVQLSHRATGKDLAGFRHRGRQLVHVASALLALSRERT